MSGKNLSQSQSELRENMGTQEVIDQTTGEIIEVEALAAEAKEVLTPGVPIASATPFLWKIGRAIRANENATDTTNQRNSIAIVQSEIDRLEAVKGRMLDKLSANVAQLTAIAENVMSETAIEKIKLDGVGTFRYRKLPVKVVDLGNPKTFDDLTPDERLALAKSCPDQFKVETIVKPVKAAIKKAIDSGQAVPHFALEDGGRKFEFESET